MNEPVKLLSQNDMVQSLLLPTASGQVLLPNVNIAEIVSGADVESVDGLPNWCFGQMQWRGQTLPLISFDRLNGRADHTSQVGQVAVLHAVGGSSGLAFFALAISGVPRQVRVMNDEIGNDTERLPGAAELSCVRVSGEAASIPDLSYIEERLVSFGLA